MIFITGASGFLGSVLCKKLIDRGEQVVSLKRPTTRTTLLGEYAQKVKWVDGDVLDIPSLEQAMQGCTHVYHCAAMISFDPSQYEQMYKVHAEGTANIVNVAIYRHVKKWVHVSSIAALSASKNGELIHEASDWATAPYPAHYGKSKHMAECEAWRAMAEGLDTVIVNPGTILGNGYWNEGSGNFFSNIDKGLPFYTSGSNGFVDVRDVADAMIWLMNSDIKNDNFILVAENLAFKELFIRIAKCLNAREPFLKVNKILGYVAILQDRIASMLSGKPRLLSTESIQLAEMQFTYDNTKIKKVWPQAFRKIDDTIQDTCDAYIEAKKG